MPPPPIRQKQSWGLLFILPTESNFQVTREVFHLEILLPCLLEGSSASTPNDTAPSPSHVCLGNAVSCNVLQALVSGAGTWEVTSGPGDLESLPVLGPQCGSLGEAPHLALHLGRGVVLRGCLAWEKAGNGACTSPEEYFWVDKKDSHSVQTWPALGQRVWQMEHDSPFAAPLARCPCAVNILDNCTQKPFREMFRTFPTFSLISLPF